jgi:hypothetical protein
MWISGWIIHSVVARPTRLGYACDMLLEIGIVALSIVCFVLLDLYVVGCERV